MPTGDDASAGPDPPEPPRNREGVARAIALLTVLLDEAEADPEEAVVQAVAPDLGDVEEVERLVRGLSELNVWLLIHLEELSGSAASSWLQRAALELR